jgi:Domain of unknown function (DUF4342)
MQEQTMNDSIEQQQQSQPPAPSTAPIVTVDAEPRTEAAPDQPDQKVSVEEFSISGDSLVAKVKELIHEGNIRRIIIKHAEGQTLIEIPLTVGVVGGVIGAALFPVVTAVAVIGSMVAHLTIVVEKSE